MEVLADHPALQVVVIIPGDMRVHFPDTQTLQAGEARAQPGIEDVLARVRAPQEAHVVGETLADLQHTGLAVEELRLVVERCASRVLAGVLAGRARCHQVRIPVEPAEEADICVSPDDPVPVAGVRGGQSVHDEKPDVGARQQISSHAKHRIVAALGGRRGSCLHGKGADREPAQLSRQPDTCRNGNGLAGGREADATTEEEQQILVGRGRRELSVVPRRVAHVEDAGILEKELALLRKELRELGEVDLLLVGLHLREVRVHGDVEREPLRDAVFQVHSRVSGPVKTGAPHSPHRACGNVRLHAQVIRCAVVHQAHEVAGERNTREVVLAGYWRPEVDLVLAADAARKVNAPRGHGGSVIAE